MSDPLDQIVHKFNKLPFWVRKSVSIIGMLLLFPMLPLLVFYDWFVRTELAWAYREWFRIMDDNIKHHEDN